jgi:hypothetical protein
MLMRVGLRRPFATISASVALAMLTLSACGSSGSSTTTHANAAAALNALRARSGQATTGGGPTGKSGSPTGKSGSPMPRPRFTAMRECLLKHGVQIPTGTGAGLGLFRDGAKPPNGVTRAQLQAAARKCLGVLGAGAAGAGRARFRRAGGAGFRHALSAFAACLRKNGIPVPTPNTSGNGPIFSTKGIDTASAKFRAATAKCRSALTGAFALRGARSPAGAQPAG